MLINFFFPQKKRSDANTTRNLKCICRIIRTQLAISFRVRFFYPNNPRLCIPGSFFHPHNPRLYVPGSFFTSRILDFAFWVRFVVPLFHKNEPRTQSRAKTSSQNEPATRSRAKPQAKTNPERVLGQKTSAGISAGTCLYIK